MLCTLIFMPTCSVGSKRLRRGFEHGKPDARSYFVAASKRNDRRNDHHRAELDHRSYAYERAERHLSPDAHKRAERHPRADCDRSADCCCNAHPSA